MIRNLLKSLQKPRPVEVLVHHFRGNEHVFTNTLVVPEGCTFHHRFADLTCIKDQKGKILSVYETQPGYNVRYEYIYKET